MISVTHFAAVDAGFAGRLQTALEALGQQPGYLRGSAARSLDEPDHWVLITEWANVGSYRRALGAFEVKLRATPLLGAALDMPSSFEDLIDVAPGAAAVIRASDRG